MIADDWSQDGKYLIYSRGTSLGDAEIWALPLGGEGKPYMVVPHGFNGHLSPNDHWLVYASMNPVQTKCMWPPSAVGKASGRSRATEDRVAVEQKRKRTVLYGPDIQSFRGTGKRGRRGPAVRNCSDARQELVRSAVFFDIAPDGKRILLDRVSQQVSQSVTLVEQLE